jgi:hypothetical protein
MVVLYDKNSPSAPGKGRVLEDSVCLSVRTGCNLVKGIGLRAGASRGSGDQVLLQGEGNGLGAAGDAQLGEYAAHVKLDGGDADNESLGDLGIRESLD